MKYLIINMLWFFLLSNIFAQTPNCISGDCLNGEGKSEYFDGTLRIVYTGSFLSGKKDGYGVYYYKSMQIKEKYDGSWKNDKKHGFGKFTYIASNTMGEKINDFIYEGEFANNEFHGKGYYINNLKNKKFNCVFNNGKLISVEDTIKYGGGLYYFGFFNIGGKAIRNGLGTLYITDKSKIVCEWKDNFIFGQAEYFYDDGGYYIGNLFIDTLDNDVAKRIGFGKYTTPDGDKIEGYFSNNLLNGKTTMFFQDGNKFECNYKNGKANGNGIYSYENGDVFKCVYQNDERNGEGKYIFRNGGSESGRWVNGKKEGFFLIRNYNFIGIEVYRATVFFENGNEISRDVEIDASAYVADNYEDNDDINENDIDNTFYDDSDNSISLKIVNFNLDKSNYCNGSCDRYIITFNQDVDGSNEWDLSKNQIYVYRKHNGEWYSSSSLITSYIAHDKSDVEKWAIDKYSN